MIVKNEFAINHCECCLVKDGTVKKRYLGPFVGPPDSYVVVYWCDECWQHEGEIDSDESIDDTKHFQPDE